jgi:hypothetical protein
VQGLTCFCKTFAIGFCKECSLPVCGKHSAILGDSRLCESHYNERQEQIKNEQDARNAALAASTARLEREQGEPFFRSGAARQLLLEAQVPTVELRVIATRRESKFLGRSEMVVDVTAAGRGWLLGEFEWRWEQRGITVGDNITGGYLTILQDETEGEPLTPAYQDKKRGGYILWRGNAKLISKWQEVSYQVRQLADKS